MKEPRPWYGLVSTLAVLICGLAVPKIAAAVEILVDAEEILEEISPRVFGNAVIYRADSMGFNGWVSNQAGYEEARRKWNYYLPYVNELGVSVLRYPHGLGANNFNWKAGVGPIEERPPNYDGQGMPQVFGTDEFLQYCEELGSEAILVVNVSVGGTRAGSVQDAADWVEYCNAPDDGSNPGGGIDWAAKRAANGHKEPYGVKYWELGNEDTYPGWEDYARRVNAYSVAMKAIDPTIEVGVIRSGAGLDAFWVRELWLDYLSFMLEEAGEAFDFWIHHTYPPGSSGAVNGFEIHREGTSVEVSFSVKEGGEYRIQIPIEGICVLGQCPMLTLWIDGEQRGNWAVSGVLKVLETPNFSLAAGEHRLRLEIGNLVDDNKVTVCQQLLLFRQAEEEPAWIDLKDSPAFYRSFMGGWALAEETMVMSKPYNGGKPVFYTEANSSYKVVTRPPHISKACAVREMLSAGCLYHAFLRNGIRLVNYWFLFEEGNGVGALEGVAYDEETGEFGRLDPHRRPVFHLLRAYRSNAFDWLVSTQVLDSPSFLTGKQTGLTLGYAQKDYELSYVDGLATVSDAGDRLSIFVINLHPEEDIPGRIELAGFAPKSQCKVLTITGPSPGANNEPEDCPSGNCVTTTEDTMESSGGRFAYRFPRHSVTVFVFHRVGSDQQPPRNPTGLRGSAGDGKILLLWDSNQEPDLGGYFIYRSKCPEGPFRNRLNSTPIMTTEYLDTRVDNHSTYTYAICGVDQSGNQSGFSNRIAITPLAGNGDPEDPPVGGGDSTPPSPPILLDVR